MDWTKLAQTAILLVIGAAIIVGNIYFQRWNRRRGERLASEARGRGETPPNRTALRVVLIAFGMILFVSGVMLLRG